MFQACLLIGRHAHLGIVDGLGDTVVDLGVYPGTGRIAAMAHYCHLVVNTLLSSLQNDIFVLMPNAIH